MTEQNKRKAYSTDVSDEDWKKVESHIPQPRTKRGRKRVHTFRGILNGILYVLRSGCTWRMLPHDFPPWSIVYHYFQVKGRKRHVLVDVMGLLLMVVVHAANIQDRDGAMLVLGKAKGKFPRLQLIWADGGYAGKLIDWVKQFCGWVLEIVKRSDDVKGFQVLPHRWVVERTFGWLNRYRRLSSWGQGVENPPAFQAGDESYPLK